MDVLRVILVGQFINCLKQYIEHCIVFYFIAFIELTVFYSFSCRFFTMIFLSFIDNGFVLKHYVYAKVSENIKFAI